MADVARIQIRDDLSELGDADPRADLPGMKQIADRHEDRDALAHRLQQARQFVRGLLIEPGNGRIEQRGLRILGEGDSDTELLAHTHGIARDAPDLDRGDPARDACRNPC